MVAIPKIAINLAKKQLCELRKWDVIAGKKPDLIISNSDFVGKRIKKSWGRVSRTIYPPVIVKQTNSNIISHGSYISVSRLVAYKRIDTIIEAFKLLPERKLIIAGEGPDRKELEKNAPKNVSFVGFLPDNKKIELIAGSKAMIQASKEDFGISVVEAQTLGIPVIAYEESGASEIVNHIDNKNPTGFLFDNVDPKKIAESISLFEKYNFLEKDCKLKAEKFSFQVFDDKIKEAIKMLTE